MRILALQLGEAPEGSEEIPAIGQNILVAIKPGGILSCFNHSGGQPIFSRSRLDDRSECYANPLGVEGHVVICSSVGTVYLRTRQALYAFGSGE